MNLHIPTLYLNPTIPKIVGIDYGSKLAGTTAIAFFNENQEIIFFETKKNQDADQFLLDWVKVQNPTYIFMDAPLSLPGIYQKLEGCNNYFYRSADQALQAMSPMFLGGLTARAMQLQAKFITLGIPTFEVYPGYLAKVLQLDKNLYKKQKEYLPVLLETLQKLYFPALSMLLTDPSALHSWHHFDALLALISGFRYCNGEHLYFGTSEEGIIFV